MNKGFGDDLLAATLRHAADNIPFYNYLKDRDKLDILEFPVVFEHQICSRLSDFIFLSRYPDFVLESGGTTGKDPSIIFRNLEEFQQTFSFQHGVRPGEYFDPSCFSSFAINLIDYNHGFSIQPSHGQPVISLPLENSGHIKVIIKILDEGLRIAGQHKSASHLVGSINKIKILTSHLMNLGRSPSTEWDVAHITTHGFHASRIWRSRLESFWGAHVESMYGLTEFNTSASRECPGCGGFRLPKTVHSEMLRPDTLTRIGEGDGVLVLTSLYPFVKVMPRIRYWTGDMFRTGQGDKACLVCGGKSLRFRGRADYCLINADEKRFEVLVSPIDIVEAVEALDDVAVDDRFQQILYDRDSLSFEQGMSVGCPAIHISIENNTENHSRTMRLKVEVSFDPNQYPSRASNVCEELLAGLAYGSPDWSQKMSEASAAVDIQILPKGALRSQSLPVIQS